MNGYDLLESIGGIKGKLVEEAYGKMEYERVAQETFAAGEERSRRRFAHGGRRGLNLKQWKPWPAFAMGCLVALLVSGVVYAGLLFSGRVVFVKENEKTDKNTGVRVILDDAVKVKTSELHGEVLEAQAVIARQVAEDDLLSSWDPHHVEKQFLNVQEAVAYVGYAGLRWPKIDEKEKEAMVSVYGKDDGKIETVSVQAVYQVTETLSANAEARLFTEGYEGEIIDGVTSYSDAFEGVDYSGEPVLANGREFQLVSSTEFENGWKSMIVYWQENGVLYSFYIRFQKGDEKAAEELAMRWMEGF